MSDDRGSKDSSSPTPNRASIAPGAKSPRSIQPPAQAHEEDDWDADEATTIFNPKAMLEAARNAAKSRAKEQAATTTPVQPAASATSSDSAAIDASPSSPISSRANAAFDTPAAPSPSKTPAPAASTETTREASAASAETTREPAGASDAIAPVKTHREGSHTEKTTPSTRAFAAVQRAAAPRADQYVWLAAGALVFVAGAWFALRSGGDAASKSPPVAHSGQVSPESSTPSLAAAPPPSRSVQAAARDIDAQRLPRTAPAASEQKPSSDEMTSVTVTALPAHARFYYKGKPVGHSPMRVELKPGEHRSFELGCPGYQTRKVTVDGTLTSMRVTMSLEPSQARRSDPTVDPGQAQSGQAQSGQAQSGQAQSGQAQ